MGKKYLFDLDGTLVNTEDTIAEIVSHVATKYGCPVSVKDAFNKYSGMSFRNRFNLISKDYNHTFDDDTLAKMHAEYTAMKEQMFLDPQLIAGARELLERLAADPTNELVLATSNSAVRAKKVIERLGLEHIFEDRIFGSNMVEGRKKPLPDVHLLAMGDHDPNETIIIEDSIVGLESAAQTGALVVNFFDPSINDVRGEVMAKHIAAGAQVIINNYDDFESAIEAHGNASIATNQAGVTQSLRASNGRISTKFSI